MTLPIDEPLHALAAMGLCAGLAWACLCRITSMSKTTTRRLIRAAYCVLFTVALTVATMPVWLPQAWAEWGLLALAAGYLLVMVANAGAWRDGPPEHARSRPTPLDGPLDRLFDEPRVGP